MRKEIIKLFPFFKMIQNTMLLGENVMKITLEINLNQNYTETCSQEKYLY